MAELRVAGLCGSLRDPSFSLSALRLAAEGAQAAGVEADIRNGADLAFPPFDPASAYDDAAKEAAGFVALCRGASGFIWASPAYHGTVSGLFKNALDYLDLLRACDPPFLTGKPVGIITVGSGTMAVVNAANTMVFVAHALRAQPLPMMIPIGLAESHFSRDGECRDPILRGRLMALGAEVARMAIASAQR
jgi:FMN reductase